MGGLYTERPNCQQKFLPTQNRPPLLFERRFRRVLYSITKTEAIFIEVGVSDNVLRTQRQFTKLGEKWIYASSAPCCLCSALDLGARRCCFRIHSRPQGRTTH